MSDDIPDPWRTTAERKGISPTYRPLAAAAGLSHETVRKVIQGRRTSEPSIRKIAETLGVEVELVHRWRGEAPPDYGREFVPDGTASLLTTEERETVNSLIRLLTRSRIEQEEVTGNAKHPAPMNGTIPEDGAQGRTDGDGGEEAAAARAQAAADSRTVPARGAHAPGRSSGGGRGARGTRSHGKGHGKA